jgi:membrane-bound lytic murein transglycosylase B
MRRLAPLALALWLAAPAGAVAVADNPPLRALIDDLVHKEGFERGQLEQLFANATFQQSIIDAITKPAEKMPWYRYRPIFMTEQRIAGGVDFWRANAAQLERAERETGVPASVITAIIGVETRYGAVTGRYRAIDALTTLTVAGLPRSGFFGTELRQLMLLGRDERLDVGTLSGSYAGALGLPQFMPSSYRAYAVDFDGDGRRDLLTSPADAIGSVANYLARHGWQRGEPISASAAVAPSAVSLAGTDPKPVLTLAELRHRGVMAESRVAPTRKAALIALETEQGNEYHLGFDNFYAITRYNHSPLYAMAVTELAAAIDERRGAPR